MLTYMHCYDFEGKSLGMIRVLDIEPYVGYSFARGVHEGHILWEIQELKNKYTHKEENIFGIDAVIKEYPYVKTYCEHKWTTDDRIKFSPGVDFFRSCDKCYRREKFNFGKNMWEKPVV